MVSTLKQMQVPNWTGLVSGGISFLCWLAAPVAMFWKHVKKVIENLRNWVLRSKIGNKVQVGKDRNIIPNNTKICSDQITESVKYVYFSIEYA